MFVCIVLIIVLVLDIVLVIAIVHSQNQLVRNELNDRSVSMIETTKEVSSMLRFVVVDTVHAFLRGVITVVYQYTS